jgi:hypothetical protein
VPAEMAPDGQIRPLPRYTVYPVQFDIKSDENSNLLPDFIARGTVRLEGKRQSLANSLFNKAISIFIKESGF